MKAIKKLLVILGGAVLVIPSFASGLVLAEGEIPTEAHLGDTISFPAKTLTYGEESLKASVRYLTPKGGLYSSSFLNVTEPGVYTVQYYASFSGHEVVENHEILSLRRSSDLFSTTGVASIANSSYSYDDSIKAVKATFQSGSSITFNKTLDLSKATKDDLLVDLLVDPSTIGSSDLTRITLTFTDAENSGNNLYITLNDSGSNCDGKGTYIKTGANTQTLVGYEGKKLLSNTEFGTPIYSSFRGLPQDDPERTNHTTKLYYDASENAVYASSSWLGTPYKRMVADLDSSTDYPGNTWGGFTSGKANLSISVSGLLSTKASVDFLQIGSFDLRTDDQRDVTAPELTIDYAGESSLPSAVAGASYRLFSASAEDDYDDDVNVTASVSYQSDDIASLPMDVSISSGSFSTVSPGTYSITYTASDVSKNVSKKTLAIPCSYSSTPISISTKQANVDATIYHDVSLLPLSETIVSGGSGNLSLSLSILDPNGTSVDYETESDESIHFVPKEVGTYQAVYVAKDYLGYVRNLIKNIKVASLSKACFVSDVYFPSAFVNGFSYELPTREAKEPGENSTIVDSDVSVTVNGSIAESSFTATGSSVSIVYKAGSGDEAYEESYSIPVIDGKSGADQTGYFYGDFGVSEESESVVLSCSKDSSLTYVNPLSPSSFTLEFNYTAANWNFGKLSVNLSELGKDAPSITFVIEKVGDGLTISSGNVTKDFPDSMGFARLYVDFTTGEVDSYLGESLFTISSFDSNKAYTGFTKAIYLSLKATGVTGDSSLALSKLDNQPLGYRGDSLADGSDLISPIIVYQNSISLKRTKGETAVTPQASAYDVLSEVSVISVSVYDPDGNKVIDSADAKVSHSFALDKLGDYTLRYTATDGQGNKTNSPKVIHVVSDPVLSVPSLTVGDINSSYKLGEEVKIPTYEVEDDSGKYTLNVILITPDNRRLLLFQNVNGEEKSYLNADNFDSSFATSSSSFTSSERGRYTLRFLAVDSDYNSTVIDRVFVVE